MDAISWFESYEGPKTLCWHEGEFRCGLGYNARGGDGRIVGGELIACAATPEAAVSRVKAEYDRLLLAT